MPLVVRDIILSERTIAQWSNGVRISTTTQIDRFFPVASVPVALELAVAIDFATDERSMVTVAAVIFDPSGQALAASEGCISSEPDDDGHMELPSPLSFNAMVTGTYTVRVFINGAPNPVLSEQLTVETVNTSPANG